MHVLFTLLSLVLLQPVTAQTNGDAVLFTYFRHDGVDGVHLAMTTNGVNLVALNGDKAVFTPPQWPGQNLTRDVSILYQHGTLFLAPRKVVGLLTPTISPKNGL